jgi:hypothetical protein
MPMVECAVPSFRAISMLLAAALLGHPVDQYRTLQCCIHVNSILLQPLQLVNGVGNETHIPSLRRSRWVFGQRYLGAPVSVPPTQRHSVPGWWHYVASCGFAFLPSLGNWTPCK